MLKLLGSMKRVTRNRQYFSYNSDQFLPKSNELLKKNTGSAVSTVKSINIDWQRHVQSYVPEIPVDSELQEHWRAMESRVLNRRPSKKIRNGPGREGVKKTDEDCWAEAGLYTEAN